MSKQPNREQRSSSSSADSNRLEGAAYFTSRTTLRTDRNKPLPPSPPKQKTPSPPQATGSPVKRAASPVKTVPKQKQAPAVVAGPSGSGATQATYNESGIYTGQGSNQQYRPYSAHVEATHPLPQSGLKKLGKKLSGNLGKLSGNLGGKGNK